jgi:hypothetical protein
MAIDPLKNTGRQNQIKSEPGDLRQSVTLYDVDYAIMTYLQDVVLPPLDDNGKSLKIPVVYGNSERWEGARRNGSYRDIHGRIQLPIMMIRRASVAKNESMVMLNRHVTYQAVTKWSKENRYDRFSAMTGFQPKRKIFNITMPDYVEITYECMGWTNFTEQLNTIVESLNWASEEYWGDKNKFKFITQVSEYTINNEVNEGNERINRVEFSLTVRAYLLPEKFDGESTIKTGFSSKKLVLTTETDLTSGTGRYENVLMTPSADNDNKDVIDFLSLNNSKVQIPIANDTITFTGIKLIKAPNILYSVISGGILISSISYDVRLFIDGTRYYQNTHFNVSYGSNSLTINFIPGTIGFNVTSANEITIAGKFINL